MKVLTVTNMWPMPESPYYGIFVKEQVEALKSHYPEVNNRVYFINGRNHKMAYLWSMLKINWLLVFNKYDVVHIHYALSGIFLLLNPFIRIPVVTTLHGSDFNTQSSLISKLTEIVLKRSTDIIYLNNIMRNHLKKYGKKMHHIPCGVDTKLFRPEKKAFRNHEEISIAFPSSRLRPEKNYGFFKEIIKHLQQRFGFKINIIEIHNKTREQVNTILNSVDLLCMTSLSEGSPQIIKEAMCCNTSVVTSNVGDVKVLLKEVKNSRVLDSYAVEEFCLAINQIVDLHKGNKVSTQGRTRIFELGMDLESTSHKLIKVYKS